MSLHQHVDAGGGPNAEPPCDAPWSSSRHAASAASSGLVAVGSLPRRSAAFVAGALQRVQWSPVRRQPAGPAPAAAEAVPPPELLGDAAVPDEAMPVLPEQPPVQLRPPWQSRSWQPGSSAGSPTDAVGGEAPPAVAAAAAEAATMLASPLVVDIVVPPQPPHGRCAACSPGEERSADQRDVGREPLSGADVANPFVAAAHKGWDE